MRYEGGEVALGKTLSLRLTPPSGGGWAFSPEIIALEPLHRFSWVGRTGLAGVFDGEHHFELEERSGGTLLINRERYSGVLSPLFKRLPQMQGLDEGFADMNDEIRRRAETLAAG